MRISLTPNIQKISSINKNVIKTATQLNNDIFIKSPSFGQINDGTSFSDFDRWAKRENFKFHARDIIDDPNNYLGKDYQGHVYTIPDCDKWVIKKHSDKGLMPMQVKETTYTEIDDVSPTINIGQAIASLRVPLNPRITEHYYIHKAQNGGALGLQNGLMKNVNSGTVGKHIESLSKVAFLEQDSFNSLVRDVRKISEMGYTFDGKTPNNLTLDTSKKRINVTGLKEQNVKKTGQYSEILYALLGSDFSERFMTSHRPQVQKDTAMNYSCGIVGKFLLAMKENNCKFEVTDNFKDLVTSSVFTKVLGTADNKEKLLKLRSAGLL